VAGPSVEPRIATPEEMPEVVSTIVAAFITDPIARFAWASPHDYLRSMPRAVQGFAGASFEHASGFASVTSAARRCGCRRACTPTTSRSGRPCRYVAMIGVEPNAQVRGLGGALLRHAVARCDEEGALAYLESSNPRNISLYLRAGVEIMGEIRVGKGPLVTPMLRRPR
jgi:ribosomal protein S18 acetylase RimI-like enzyme